MFLKRMASTEITMQNLYLGSIVSVYSRQLKLVEFGDVFTRNRFAKSKETTFALIKPDAYVHTGKIIDYIQKSGFLITRLKMGKFSAAATARFLQQNESQSAEASQLMQSDVSTGLELVSEDAVNRWKACAEELKKQFGTSAVRNAVHAS